MKVLRLPQVLAKIGLSRSTTYAMIGAGDFPKPIKLGKRAVGWVDSDVENWLTGRCSTASMR